MPSATRTEYHFLRTTRKNSTRVDNHLSSVAPRGSTRQVFPNIIG